MSVQRIVVLGGGFAGLWSAVGAARKLDELGIGPEAVEITLVNRDAYHSIRVRNYEADLTNIRISLDDVLEPISVRRVEGAAASLDFSGQIVTINTAKGPKSLAYDRLVFALGSQLVRPNIPGLNEWSFDVDTYDGAVRLQSHLPSLPNLPDHPGRFTVVVVGAGLTGIETATEMPTRLATILARANVSQPPRVILADHQPWIGSDMGESARPVIQEALTALGIETRTGVEVTAVNPDGVTLRSGEIIPAATVIWCAGLRANPMTELFAVERDRWGRLAVDEFLRVNGIHHVFAAGDAAWMMLDEQHPSVMSCQHSRPMGRFAGHNVVCDLLGLPMLPLRIPWYVTVLDLGPVGAVYTEGWDRRLIQQGTAAKQTKQTINCRRIYPPLTRDRDEILSAAAPVIQPAP